MTYPLKVVQYVCASSEGRCQHERHEYSRCQGDSDYDYYCAHPDIVAKHGRKLSKDSHRNAPSWCPLLPEEGDGRMSQLPRPARTGLESLWDRIDALESQLATVTRERDELRVVREPELKALVGDVVHRQARLLAESKTEVIRLERSLAVALDRVTSLENALRPFAGHADAQEYRVTYCRDSDEIMAARDTLKGAQAGT